MMLFIILLWPDFEADAARPEQYDDWIAGCSNLDEIEKQELDEIIELFENEEVKKIENRINGLLDSRKQLEMEKNHRSEEHTSELQSRFDHVCRLLLE